MMIKELSYMSFVKSGWVLLVLAVILIGFGSCTPLVLDETENASVNYIYINELMASNLSAGIDLYYGNFSDWIEIYNSSNEIIDLTGHFLTDNLNRPQKWPIPEGTIVEPGKYYIFWADGENIYNHTNFKLSREGEEIAIFNTLGVMVDHVIFGAQLADTSYGRKRDGDSEWGFFYSPTLESANNTTSVTTNERAPEPQISINRGFYTSGQLVELTSNNASAKIRYTIDGSIPSDNSALYTAAIQLNETAVLRARTFLSGFLPSTTITHSYFIDESFTIPVVSLTTNPANFFDPEIGIYVKGNDALPEVPYYGANFWEDWERVVHVELFEIDGSPALNMQTGVKIFGGDSKANDQKSLALYAKAKYGAELISYKFFGNKDISQFRRISLRNSGQDWSSTMFRDGLHQSLVMDQMNLDFQSYRPAHLFINGAYWGMQNIREKIDGHYVTANYNIPVEEVDFLYHFDGDIRASEGDRQHYDSMLNFMNSNDLSLPENYDYIKTQIDVAEYINYQVIQMYIANSAWLSENTKLWRQRVEGGKWRWILFDTDFGTGLYSSYQKNMLEHSVATDGPSWPNPPWSTYLFRKMLEFPQFREDFVQTFASHLNTTFLPDRVLAIIEGLQENIRSGMIRAIERWGGTPGELLSSIYPTTLEEWDNNVAVMKQFAQRRPEYARQHLIDFFELEGTLELRLNIYTPSGGKVLINGAPIPTEALKGGQFRGIYFKGIPIKLNVIPNPGFQFAGLSGVQQESDGFSVVLKEDRLIDILFISKNQ
jgi:CotH kinase protein/Chitobiase/beta-hexosaminidase C-terminal domain/Lamin Tail Domain